MRLSDAVSRQQQTKLLYFNHRPPPWCTEDATPRSLEPIVRCRSQYTKDPDTSGQIVAIATV
jgi:hypothetical protein